jgi:hypothetical protein
MRTCFLLTLCALFTGCADDTLESEPYDGLLEPPAAGKGVQFGMTTKIESGTEAEMCRFVQAPKEGLFIQRDEVRITPGNHHFLLFETDYSEIPTQHDDGTPVDTSGVFDCSAGPAAGWSIKKIVAGSQNAQGGSFLRFPEHVALSVHPGAVLMLNAHLINTTDHTLEPEAAINLFTVPASEVEQEGDALFLYDAFIGVRAHEGARAQVRCPVNADITLVNFQSHMHRRGVGHQASVGGEQPFYENTHWENVPVADFGEGKKIAKGSVIDFHCDYQNNEDHDIFQGPRSTDEMCIAIGAYYPAEPNTSACAVFGVDGTRNLGGEWVGQGTNSCAQTMGCVQTALGKENPTQQIMLCVADSDPAKSKVVSDALRCFATHKDPLAECGPEFSVCLKN